MSSIYRSALAQGSRREPSARPPLSARGGGGAGASKLNPSTALPPLSARFTPSDASLEVLQLLNADREAGGEPSQMSEDAVRHTLQEWLRTYDAEQNQYASVTVFAEMKLRQALVVTAKLGLPNAIRTAAVCSCFDLVASLFHRYEGLLRTLRGEMLRAIYVDFRPGVVGGGAQAYSMCTTYFEELRKEKRKTAELQLTIKQWGDERFSSLKQVDDRRKSLDAIIEQLKRVVMAAVAAQHEAAAVDAAPAPASDNGEGGDAHGRLMQLVPELEAAVEALRQEQETAFLDPLAKVTRLQEGLSQYQQLRHLQKSLRALGPSLMAEMPPAERASMTASLLEGVPDAELQQLLLELLLLRSPPQLLELLDVAAAELDQTMASQLLVSFAERCAGGSGGAGGSGAGGGGGAGAGAGGGGGGGGGLSLRRSSMGGDSSERRRSSEAATATAGIEPPAPLPFSAVVAGVLRAAPEDARSLALKEVLTDEQIVPPNRRAMLAGALGAPVGEIAMLQQELQRSRQQAAALQSELMPLPPPEPTRFKSLFGVAPPPALPDADGGAAAEAGALPLQSVRLLIADLYAAQLQRRSAAAAQGGGGAGGGVVGVTADEALAKPFARLVWEMMLRRCGLRSVAKQQLLHVLAALSHHAAAGRSKELLLFGALCGVGGGAAPWAQPKVAFFFDLLAALLALQPSATLQALLAAPRAVVPLSGVRQVGAVLLSAESHRRLLEALQRMHDNPAERMPAGGGAGGAGEPAGSLEELLPLFVDAYDMDRAPREQRLRSAFAEAQPASGVLSLPAFVALVRALDGAAALSDATVFAMYQQALECSGGLLDEAESDIVLLEAFVYVCQTVGL